MQATNGQLTRPAETTNCKPSPLEGLSTAPSFSLRSLTAVLDINLFPRQIGKFRGAVAELAGWENDLFHNHKDGEGRHARYPLIQYRMRQGKAAIFALQDGVDALTAFLMSGHSSLKMDGRHYRLSILHLQQQEHILKIDSAPQTYKLFKWLPLNPENYEKWQQCEDLVARVRLLESILSSQLVGFCASMGWQATEWVSASIQHLQLMEKVTVFGVSMLSFNITYTTHLVMPPGIGLGKAVSRGFGWQVPAPYCYDNDGFRGNK